MLKSINLSQLILEVEPIKNGIFIAKYSKKDEQIARLMMSLDLTDEDRALLPEEYHNSCYLENLKVSKDFRRKGLGKNLLDQAKIQAVSLNRGIVLFAGESVGDDPIPIKDLAKFYRFNAFERIYCAFIDHIYHWRGK